MLKMDGDRENQRPAAEPEEPGLIGGRPAEDRSFEAVELAVGIAAGVGLGLLIAGPIGAAVGGPLGGFAGLVAGEAVERAAGPAAETWDASQHARPH